MKKSMKSLLAGTAFLLMAVGAWGLNDGQAFAASEPVAPVADQQQTSGNYNMHVGYGDDSYQTFTAGMDGLLSRIDLQLWNPTGSQEPGRMTLYREGNQSEPLAVIENASFPSLSDAGWVSVDFSEKMPLLKKDTLYRMVLSPMNPGGSFTWTGDDNRYDRGYTFSNQFDFSFRTYMIPPFSQTASILEVTGPESVDGNTAQYTVTLHTKDDQGGDWIVPGTTASIYTTAGTVGPVTSRLDGSYTAVLQAPLSAGQVKVSASVNGLSLQRNVSVNLTADPYFVKSTISVKEKAPADGVTLTPITVTLIDSSGKRATSGGADVRIFTNFGPVGPVQDNGDGTYTAMLQSPQFLGPGVVDAIINGQYLTDFHGYIKFVPGPPSEERSLFRILDYRIPADGVASTTVSWELYDKVGHPVDLSEHFIQVKTTSGTIEETYANKAILKAPLTTGVGNVTLEVDEIVVKRLIAEFVPLEASFSHSIIESSLPSLPADGESQAVIRVKLRDALNHSRGNEVDQVRISSSLGSVSGTYFVGDGTYEAVLTAPVQAGTAEIQVSVNRDEWTAAKTILLLPGEVALSTLEAREVSLPADGTSQTLLVVKLADENGNPIAGKSSALELVSNLGIVGEIHDHGDGSYSANLTASDSPGTAVVRLSVNGQAAAQTATVRFVTGGVSPDESTVTASDLLVRADGIQQSTISVTLRDEYRHSLAGREVLLTQDGNSVIEVLYGVTDENGQAVFRVGSTIAKTVTYSAFDAESGTLLTQKARIAFTYDQPPVIGLTFEPETPTFGSVTLSVSASVYGAANRVAVVKWASGNLLPEAFRTQGTVIQDQFTVTANGIYSVYVEDAAGNANVRTIEVQNIVPPSGDSSLAGWQVAGLGGAVAVDFRPEIVTYTASVSNAVSRLSMKLLPNDAYASVSVNGEPAAVGVWTKEYGLATGSGNLFTVAVKAQDGSISTYTLRVTRAAPDLSPKPEQPNTPGPSAPGSSTPGSSAGPLQPAVPSTSVKIRLNGQEQPGAAKVLTRTDGTKTIEARLERSAVEKMLNGSSAAPVRMATVDIPDKVDETSLQLTPDAIAYLSGRTDYLLLKTAQGQYRLPLSELPDITEGLRLTVRQNRANQVPALQQAAERYGVRLAGDPVTFAIEVTGPGGKRELSEFSQYAERVIYLPNDSTVTPTTAALWDPETGFQPVPTEFTEMDGRRVAVIHSLTNRTYVLLGGSEGLKDVDGHWAGREIAELNRRLIIQGTDNRFEPEKSVVRAELAVMLQRALGLPVETDSEGFRDVSESDWFREPVQSIYARGIMGGSGGGAFKPLNGVTRQEAVVALVRALRLLKDSDAAQGPRKEANPEQYTDWNEISPWAADSMKIAIETGLLKGNGSTLHPQKPLSRAELAVLLHRMLQQAGVVHSR